MLQGIRAVVSANVSIDHTNGQSGRMQPVKSYLKPMIMVVLLDLRASLDSSDIWLTCWRKPYKFRPQYALFLQTQKTLRDIHLRLLGCGPYCGLKFQPNAE
jgi:hypothetical protein